MNYSQNFWPGNGLAGCRFGGLLLLACILAIPNLVGRTGPTEEHNQRTEACETADPELLGLLNEVDILVLGEIHGSQEVPTFTEIAVCAALELTKPVILSLEIPTAEQQRIETFLKSSGDSDARSGLLEGPFWQRDQQDGRSSQAMLGLLEASRKLIQAGQPLTVHCFDAPVGGPDDTRDHSMARSILARRSGNPGSKMVVLTGNIHARKSIGISWNPERKPTGWYLDQAVEQTVMLNVRNAPGTFWVCTPQCGVQNLGCSGSPEARGFELYEDPDRMPYHGVFDIGVPTASEPARKALTSQS